MNIKMKVISCFFVLAGITSTLSASTSADNETGLEQISGDKLTSEGATLTATVNDYADQLMRNMDIMVIKAGLDPMIVPDIETKISRRFLLITYWGKLKLSKIKVSDFSTIHRYDHAVITYNKDTKRMKIDIPLELSDIEFKCHYKATLMGLGPFGASGGLDGKMKSVRMITSIEIDFTTFKADVAQYKITHTDHITVHFHEFILIDWMIDILANTVTMIFKGLIVNIVDQVVGGTLEASVNLINTVFEDIEEIIEGNSTAPVLKNVGSLWSETKYYVS